MSKNQHVIVIGGSSGIGLATAATLIERGYRVTIAGRDAAKLDAANRHLGGKASAIIADSTDAAALRALFDKVGPFDHLVTTVSSGRGLGTFAELDLADLSQGFIEKVQAQLLSAQIALKTIRKDGSITFVSAASAAMSSPGMAGVATVNGAMNSPVVALAAELKPLRVNAVAPGVIDTPWWNTLPAEQRSQAFAHFAGLAPAGRIGTSEDVADTIAFLIGNSFVTGQRLYCDGGLSLVA
ncbi:MULTISPECIES: SDR family oxidoreductase [Phyllobacteriaceae]|jgi:NAD(P)-dependent dehydrogenase (short-subunit alcohol dehydrogenase family)|uniref:Short-chain dehydrogenase n=1 Tax=Mesorhizobium hungaricum TaxID=1566387 RepID=A0A1C2DYI1_9HYPH|nr:MULTISPECIES: SDR family oxidoreductase [Mesorhizobium]MBN9234753.1 SDR family oxidoreductase [Mesorhizobium sp.]MDQ0328766.1 NAD(P)-dependent dehydrogenase (short-subunit alcohol dehydrogenase family) [Mesorhizobium sp. YL-MeA3-2017]OCX19829.1 short-chain dehydrogenase [Mesorhizobium hungaricum]